MHAVSHCLPHRGPGATRARARWQPYSSVALSSGLNTPPRTSPSFPYLPTPASSICSSPPTIQVHAVCDPDSLKVHQSNHASRAGSLRDAQKSRYVTGLVDQAIRSLCDTWRPENIPSAFTHPPLSTASGDSCSTTGVQPVRHERLHDAVQLLSPVSPSTQSTASPTSTGPSNVCNTLSGDNAACIKGFVHEVLRRSRTSVGVLQTALCYLEAVRTRIPDVLRKDEQQDLDDASNLARIIVEEQVDEQSRSNSTREVFAEDVDTVRMSDHTDSDLASSPEDPVGVATRGTSATPALPPLPLQPSPLLCPRRTFLACLILATKFMQDRSYSNRAWAKLAGLPPREIGRCERAVGNVLEWRLWVGKDLNVGTGTSKRPLLRSKSDGDVLNTATAHIPISVSYLTPPATPLAFGDGKDTTSVDHGPLGPSQAENPRVRNLRRCATIASVSVEPPVARAYAHGQLLSAPLVEEPVGYEGSDARPSTSANRFAAAYDCGAPSPQWFTPPLTYSPMSTSSASSDGADDRTVQLADFPELSVNAGFSAGSTDAWRNRSDGEAFDAAYPKPSGFNFLGPQMSSAHPPAIVDVNAPYLAPTDTGPFQVPPISVGFPFYG